MENINYGAPTDAARLRDLLARAGLSQRGAAAELDINERTMRNYCAAAAKVPRVVFLALERLVEVRAQVEDKGK
jgi:hypothetical protein